MLRHSDISTWGTMSVISLWNKPGYIFFIVPPTEPHSVDCAEVEDKGERGGFRRLLSYFPFMTRCFRTSKFAPSNKSERYQGYANQPDKFTLKAAGLLEFEWGWEVVASRLHVVI